LTVGYQGPQPDVPLVNQSGVSGRAQAYPFPIGRLNLPAHTQYGSMIATWGSLTATVAPGFATLGSTRFSQYNTPTESQCGTTTSPAFVFRSDGTCTWTQAELNPRFMEQVDINGDGGASNSYPMSAAQNANILKPWFATSLMNKAGEFQCGVPQVTLPDGSTLTANLTKKPDNNVFVAVKSVTGTCNSQLANLTSLAVYPSPKVNAGWLCTTNPTYHDQVLLFGGNNGNIATKIVQDACPACVDDFRRANVSHIDTYSSSAGCLAHDPTIQDLPDSYAVRLR
jgi:hypothetical protein